MDIACPNCAATYRVPDSLLARGMALRCAACDHEWVPEAPPAAAALPPAPTSSAESPTPPAPPPDALLPPPAPPPALSLAEAPRTERPAPPTTPPPLQRRAGPGPMAVSSARPARRRLPRALPLAWAASVALVVMALAGLVIFGEEIALAWPPFARVTSLLSG